MSRSSVIVMCYLLAFYAQLHCNLSLYNMDNKIKKEYYNNHKYYTYVFNEKI